MTGRADAPAAAPASAPEDPDPGPAAGGGARVAIAVECAEWLRACPGVEAACREAVAAALAAAAPGAARPPGEVCVLLAGDARTRELNRRWRGRDRPADVLSFPAGPPPAAGVDWPLGDIVLGLGAVRRDCARLGLDPRDRARHLAVHGCLHLLGHAHDDEAEAAEMEALEVRVLADLGAPDPYVLPAPVAPEDAE